MASVPAKDLQQAPPKPIEREMESMTLNRIPKKDLEVTVRRILEVNMKITLFTLSLQQQIRNRKSRLKISMEDKTPDMGFRALRLRLLSGQQTIFFSESIA